MTCQYEDMKKTLIVLQYLRFEDDSTKVDTWTVMSLLEFRALLELQVALKKEIKESDVDMYWMRRSEPDRYELRATYIG